LRSPLHWLLSGRLALLTFYGRKSGRRYTTPVGYGRTDDALLVDTESPWWRNLRGGAWVGVRLQGRDRAGTAEVITDEALMREAYRIILAATPGYGRALGISLSSDGLPRREDIARIRQKGHVVVRIELDL
jgi:deazaflavin-dependent oxidoreductase (nitroreductase family)